MLSTLFSKMLKGSCCILQTVSLHSKLSRPLRWKLICIFNPCSPCTNHSYSLRTLICRQNGLRIESACPAGVGKADQQLGLSRRFSNCLPKQQRPFHSLPKQLARDYRSLTSSFVDEIEAPTTGWGAAAPAYETGLGFRGHSQNRWSARGCVG